MNIVDSLVYSNCRYLIGLFIFKVEISSDSVNRRRMKQKYSPHPIVSQQMRFVFVGTKTLIYAIWLCGLLDFVSIPPSSCFMRW